jgi:DNA-binding transcriptional regulator GbsR (MarR family)
VRAVHVLGDRRDHFQSLKDVWEIFRIVAQERKRREVDPTVRVVRECVEESVSAAKGRPYEHQRLKEMLEFLTVVTGLLDETLPMPIGALKGVVKLRGKVITLFGKDKTEAVR